VWRAYDVVEMDACVRPLTGLCGPHTMR
jgi:hypothetical protein